MEPDETDETWIRLTDECRGKYGILDVPENILSAIELAACLTPDQPHEPLPNYALYLKQCRRWGANSEEITLARTLGAFFQPQPVYLGLTVDHIKVREAPFRGNTLTIDDVDLVPGLKEGWRWVGYPEAYALFWAFTFHQKNEDLLSACDTFDWLKNRWDSRDDWPFLLLALYERLLGIQHDIREKTDCYRKNILERPGLTPAECADRASYFDSFITNLQRDVTTALESALENI